LWVSHSTKWKDIAVRKASNASTKVFKDLLAQRRLNPPVLVCHKIKVVDVIFYRGITDFLLMKYASLQISKRFP